MTKVAGLPAYFRKVQFEGDTVSLQYAFVGGQYALQIATYWSEEPAHLALDQILVTFQPAP